MRYKKNCRAERKYPRKDKHWRELSAQSWGSDLTGEDVVAAHMAEKSASWPGPEPVLSFWKSKKQSIGAQVNCARGLGLGTGGQACRCTKGIWHHCKRKTWNTHSEAPFRAVTPAPLIPIVWAGRAHAEGVPQKSTEVHHSDIPIYKPGLRTFTPAIPWGYLGGWIETTEMEDTLNYKTLYWHKNY